MFFLLFASLVFLIHGEWNLERMAMEVNAANGVAWEAEPNPRFAQMTETEFQALLGAKIEFAENVAEAPLSNDDTPIPEEFDARKVWPHCPTIGYIYDQGHCGSCWAMCSFEVLQDRICIASKGVDVPWLSGQDITSCDRGSHGCNGFESARF